MSSSNFTQALVLTINYWDELGIWNKNKAILKSFLTLCTPPPNLIKQKKLVHNLIKYYHTNQILSLDDLHSLLSILESASYVNTTIVDYDEGVDYPVSFGINKIINKYSHLGYDFLSRFTSEFISTTYSNLRKTSFYEHDRKIYNSILATRELTFRSIINIMINEGKLPKNTKNISNKDTQRYSEYLNNTTYSIEENFWVSFNYHPLKRERDIQIENKRDSKKKNVNKDKSTATITSYLPRSITIKKKSWNTAKKEIESYFDYSALSLQSVLSFIIFVDQKKSELSNLLILCFLTGLTLKKAISSIRNSTHKEALHVFISNTPTNSDLCSEIQLKISPKSLLHLDEKQLSIDELVNKISEKFSYLTRQFSMHYGGNTLHFDRIASNSNRLLSSHYDDIRIHYLRGKIGFSMSAPFSYISTTNEEVGMLYKERFDTLSKQLNHYFEKSLEELKWDSTLALQLLGSQRLPTASIAKFFNRIRKACRRIHENFILTKNDQLRIDLINLQEIYVYFLEQILFSNRPDGAKSISILSDVLIRKDKNSINYIEYKTLPIPELYEKQRNILNKLRIDIYSHFKYCTKSSDAPSCMLHCLKDGIYYPVYPVLNRQVLEILKSFKIEPLSESHNTLRHYSGNALRSSPVLSRKVLGHNEDGYYYTSPASSSNITASHQDILDYQSDLINEFDLKVLHYDFD